MKLLHWAAVLFLLARVVEAAPPLAGGSDKDGNPWYEFGEGSLAKMRLDRNSDGRADYCVHTSSDGRKVYEEFDFNYDGSMDDFCFYEDGELVREEIDSNYDGRIDIWVYLHQGIYIERYEQDTDGDGKPDRVRQFGGS